jgi:hypothetical protein
VGSVHNVDTKTTRQLARLSAEADAAMDRRDAAIRDAIANGATLRDVAGAVGLSRGGVAKIRDRG